MNTLLQKYSKFLLLGIFAILCVVIGQQYTQINKLKNDFNITKNNEKAFMLENSILKEKNIAFEFTIEQLTYYKDSIIHKMDSIRQILKVKDEDLKQMQYISSIASRVDTLILTDTIFVDKNFNIDTLIGDKWYTLNLGLQYPNMIRASPKFVSEKFVILSTKKETINPPKKWAICRWFQKKHTIVEVEVVENNPYIEINKQRFIEIIK